MGDIGDTRASKEGSQGCLLGGGGGWGVGDEIPPSSRDEGLRLLHGLETNLAASLQAPQEA